jgi:hypothetical protein
MNSNGRRGTAPKRPMDAAAAAAGMDGASKNITRGRRPHPLGRRQKAAGAHEPLGKPATRTAGFPQRPQAQLASGPQQR